MVVSLHQTPRTVTQHAGARKNGALSYSFSQALGFPKHVLLAGGGQTFEMSPHAQRKAQVQADGAADFFAIVLPVNANPVYRIGVHPGDAANEDGFPQDGP